VAPDQVDLLVFGIVVADPSTSNVAREVGLASGLPHSVPAYTVTVACVSANTAILNAANAIALGQAEVAVAGGTDTLSDAPIRFSRPVRKRLIASQKAKGLMGKLGLLKGLKLKDLAPEVPALADFSTGLTMGQNAERLAKRLGITRGEQDAYALRSHHLAAKAQQAGLLKDQIIPVYVPPSFKRVDADNGVRADASAEKLASLKPAFDRRFGTVTAANSSYLTDGASAVLLMSEEKAASLGVKPLAAIRSASLTAMDPLDELLLGPAFAIPDALDRAGLALEEIGVFEIHEAFAAQMVAILKLLADHGFAMDRLGRGEAVGAIPMDKLNLWGGSLSLGHPFGATGGRLVTTCCRRMEKEGAKYGLVAACAAGAIGNAIVLERV
jgi:acetyl-CoA acyltransferase